MARDSFLKTAAPLVVLTFVGVYNFPPITEEEIAARDAVEQSVHYGGCNEVRAAGKAPLGAILATVSFDRPTDDILTPCIPSGDTPHLPYIV